MTFLVSPIAKDMDWGEVSGEGGVGRVGGEQDKKLRTGDRLDNGLHNETWLSWSLEFSQMKTFQEHKLGGN